MSIGSNIKRIRKEAKLTQDQLASLIGISKNGLWNYENEKRDISVDLINKIAAALEVPVNELIGRREATQKDIDNLFDDPNAFNTAVSKNELLEAVFLISKHVLKEEPKTAEINILLHTEDSKGMKGTVPKTIKLKDRLTDKDYLKYKLRYYENTLEKLLEKDADKEYLENKSNYYKELLAQVSDETTKTESREATQEDIDKLID